MSSFCCQSLETLSRGKGIETLTSRTRLKTDQSFGDTFPREGNRNSINALILGFLCSFGDTFPWQGNRNRMSRLFFMLPTVLLWRHFPERRESKLGRLESYIGVQSALETLSRAKGIETTIKATIRVSILPLETLSRAKGIETSLSTQLNSRAV